MATQPEAETILQPSLHTIPEYRDMVFDEAESRGVDVSDLRKECEEDTEDGEWDCERIDDALQRIGDAGYPYVEADDTLLIWPKGSEIPEEWRD